MTINNNIKEWLISCDPLTVKGFMLLATRSGGDGEEISTRKFASILNVTHKVGRRVIAELQHSGIIECQHTNKGMRIAFKKFVEPSDREPEKETKEEIRGTIATQKRTEMNVANEQKAFVPPSLEEITSYAYAFASENKITFDVHILVLQWEAYNAMKGWKIKNKLMADWKGSLRYWIMNEVKKQTRNGNSTAFARNNTEAFRICAKYAY